MHRHAALRSPTHEPRATFHREDILVANRVLPLKSFQLVNFISLRAALKKITHLPQARSTREKLTTSGGAHSHENPSWEIRAFRAALARVCTLQYARAKECEGEGRNEGKIEVRCTSTANAAAAGDSRNPVIARLNARERES